MVSPLKIWIQYLSTTKVTHVAMWAVTVPTTSVFHTDYAASLILLRYHSRIIRKNNMMGETNQ